MRRIMLALVLSIALAGGQACAQSKAHVTKDGVANDGTEVQVDLPRVLHVKNVGGSDGAGLCVFTSIQHSAYWQRVEPFQGFQAFMRSQRGGGWPEKVDAMAKMLCTKQGVEKPLYLQVQSNDLDVLRLACKTGRMPAITYAYSPTKRYGGQKIAHMVNLVAAGVGQGPDGKGWWVILDNNYPGSYEWMSEAEFTRAYRGGAQGWCVILLDPAPPPPPRN